MGLLTAATFYCRVRKSVPAAILLSPIANSVVVMVRSCVAAWFPLIKNKSCYCIPICVILFVFQMAVLVHDIYDKFCKCAFITLGEIDFRVAGEFFNPPDLKMLLHATPLLISFLLHRVLQLFFAIQSCHTSVSPNHADK